MTRTIDPVSHAVVIGYKYTAISAEVLQADDALTEIGEALQVAERSSDDIARALVRLALGAMLMQRDSQTDVDADSRCSPGSATCASRSATP